MTVELVIRNFETSDAPEVTRLLHRAYEQLGAAGMNFTAVDQSEEKTLARAAGGRCWVGLVDGAIVGTITMSFPPEQALQAVSGEAAKPGQAWLNQLAVDPSMQGQGVARQLWRLGLDWAKTVAAVRVGLDTAEPAGHLIELYTRWGFAHTEWVQWPGKTYRSAIMVLPLPLLRFPAPARMSQDHPGNQRRSGAVGMNGSARG